MHDNNFQCLFVIELVFSCVKAITSIVYNVNITHSQVYCPHSYKFLFVIL